MKTLEAGKLVFQRDLAQRLIDHNDIIKKRLINLLLNHQNLSFPMKVSDAITLASAFIMYNSHFLTQVSAQDGYFPFSAPPYFYSISTY